MNSVRSFVFANYHQRCWKINTDTLGTHTQNAYDLLAKEETEKNNKCWIQNKCLYRQSAGINTIKWYTYIKNARIQGIKVHQIFFTHIGTHSLLCTRTRTHRSHTMCLLRNLTVSGKRKKKHTPFTHTPKSYQIIKLKRTHTLILNRDQNACAFHIFWFCVFFSSSTVAIS